MAKRPKPTAKTRSGFFLLRVARAHVRLLVSVLVGIAVFIAVPASAHVVTRMLIGWDIGVLLYLVAGFAMMAQSTADEISAHADAQDEGAAALLVLTIAASIASFGAIFIELANAEQKAPGYGLQVALAIATVVLSWTFVHTIMALHYAYEFYGEAESSRGLKFPGDEPPDYWDFIYFAFVIGMTFQVSDVAVTNKIIRRTVVAHGVLSFVFTTAIVALTVNVAASALQR